MEASLILGGQDSYLGESMLLASTPIISASKLRTHWKKQSGDDKIGKKRKEEGRERNRSLYILIFEIVSIWRYGFLSDGTGKRLWPWHSLYSALGISLL